MRDPEGIRTLVGKLVAELGLAEVVAAGRLFREWKEIVGNEVAARSQPLSLREGVLRIQTDSAAWANEVRYLAPEILRRANAALGGPVAHELRVSFKPAPREPAPTRPRDAPAPHRSPARAPREPTGAGLPIRDAGLADAVARVLDAARASRRDNSRDNKGGKRPR